MMKWLLMCLFMLASPSLSLGGVVTTLDGGGGLRPPIRAVHFVLRAVQLKDAYHLVDKASKAHFNTIQLVLTDGVKLTHAPWTPRRDAWRKSELLAWAKYARSRGLRIVPELKLLTHQEKFFQKNHHDLMFNSKTYDPNKAKVYEIIFPLLDEIIGLLQPKAIHIGHDEVVGRVWRRKYLPDIRVGKLEEGEEMLPASLFLKDVLTIHDYLKGKGIETWMWGDMLLSPDEFPSMRSRQLHGGDAGYGKALRNKLPKDIVICDWHYFDNQKDFPSLKAMHEEGFRVIGATWKKEKTIVNFSSYAAMHHAYGMMATTWWHVQKKDWDVVDRIIHESGQVILNDFPDVK